MKGVLFLNIPAAIDIRVIPTLQIFHLHAPIVQFRFNHWKFEDELPSLIPVCQPYDQALRRMNSILKS